ncbi:MAG: hypothetical protein KatS3mg013_2074 [Actinomycetota bacterium]|nr:MAG: hypothetical protein KatS3mg013_2074 [Actinomycetota bacterium]
MSGADVLLAAPRTGIVAGMGPELVLERLRGARNADGGYGPSPGAPSEPEPTALVAIALADKGAARWLTAHQRADGSFGVVDGPVRDEAATGLAAVAMPAGPARERALDRLEVVRGRRIGFNPAVPHDDRYRGWPWTDGTFGWVEPTARALLALRRFRPRSPRIAEGVALLRDRRSVGGGWNYGNRVVLGVELPPFAHTTAVALLGLRGLDPPLEAEGLRALARLWREEDGGVLSVATALAAFRASGWHDEVASARARLSALLDRSELQDTVADAWAAIALGPGLERLVG